MTKKHAGIFGPSISLWQYGVAMTGAGGSFLLWPDPLGILFLGGLMVLCAAVEGIVIAVKGIE